MFGNTIHILEKTDLVELTEIVVDDERSKILINFTRFLVKSIRILIEIINSQSTRI